jgi:hypothetical protein
LGEAAYVGDACNRHPVELLVRQAHPILDEVLELAPNGRVACPTSLKTRGSRFRPLSDTFAGRLTAFNR